MSHQRLIIALLVTALIAGCSKTSSPPTPSAAEASTPAAGQEAAASRHFAGLLPPDTIAYGRLRDAGTLKDRWVQPGLLTDTGLVQQQVTQWYAGLLDAAGRNNPFGLPPETVQEFAGSLRSVHVAVVAADNRLQEPALFFEMANGAVVSKIRQQLAGRATEKVLQGTKVLDLTTLPGQPAQTLYVLDDTVLVVGPDPVLAQVIAARTGGRKHSLAEVEAFRKVETELGRTGDLFVYFSAGDLRAALLREMDADSTPAAPQVATAEVRPPFPQDQRERAQRRRAEIENIPFKEIGHVGASMGLDGSLTVRAYAAPGKKLPDFLVRRPAEKQLFRRIPADALLAYAWTYEGGKQTRKAFSEWLKEEMKTEGTSLVPAPLAQVVTQQLDRLEADVVVMAQDLWVAALPVKTELAFALTPDAAGRWGVLLGFDVEDRTQAEKLRQQIFETGRRHNLAWKETTYEGLTIHYLDLEEMLQKDGAHLPPELAQQVQLKIGYALGDELFLVGSVEAIKFAHRPAGPVLADVVKRDHIDPANAFHLTLQPGRFLHGNTRVAPREKLLQVLRRQVPKDASWSITLNLQEDQATLRGNVPFAALAAWVGLDLSEFAQALR